jgi:hypothetical protein
MKKNVDWKKPGNAPSIAFSGRGPMAFKQSEIEFIGFDCPTLCNHFGINSSVIQSNSCCNLV